jgi:hypothetical protein
MTPKIVFVAACSGAGGHYLARILQTMTRGWKPNESNTYFHLHRTETDANVIDNIPSLPYANIEEEIRKYCGLGSFTGNRSNLTDGYLFFREHFKYKTLGFPFHIVMSHVINPMPFLGIEFSKVIRININVTNEQQLSYNFVKKLIQTDVEELKDLALTTAKKELGRVQKNTGKLLHIDPNNIDLTDDKLLTYINWQCNKSSIEDYASVNIRNSSTVFNVEFADLMYGGIRNQLADIATFLNWQLDDETMESCNKLIDLYTKEQKNIPWLLEDYDY